MRPILSITIAAHREGLIAHKTMLSLQRATKKLIDSNITYEVIVTIDSGDQETHDYFSKYHSDSRTTIHEVDFGDLAMSRNYAVSLAKGIYIATLDADDLVSENWFIDSLNLLSKLEGPAVLHTQYSINFGTQDIIWEKFDSRTKEEDAVIMSWANRWDSATIAPRQVFEKFPYQPNNEGYGSEDWHFNSQTLAANIPHKVTPETILFVRRKDVSMMTIQAADRRTLRYTELLNFNFLRTIDPRSFAVPDERSIKDTPSLMSRAQIFTKKNIRYIHHKAKSNPIYLQSTRKIVSAIKNHHNIKSKFISQRFPNWLLTEWRAIHALDKSIFPDEQLVENIPLYHSEMHELGVILCKLASSLTKNPNYIMFVPSLTKGGAELVAIRYLEAIKKAHPEWHIAVIATEKGDNSWVSRLPDNVEFIPYGELTNHLPEQLRLQLLARLIVQSKATHLHIAQSPLMFRFAELYKTLLRPLVVYAFAFCEDTDNQGRVAGHVHSGLPYAYNTIDKIFTDCTSIATSLIAEYGYDDAKFITHYQPITTQIKQHKQNKEGILRILWASRIAKQKRPDILAAVGEALINSDMQVDVYGSFQDGYTEDLFSGIKNLTYKGAFNGIDSIPTDQYDIFLYTSENDGIPNIILEAAAKGLVVIAPNIGGISEFINNETGVLIENYESVHEYTDALKSLSIDPSRRKAYVKAAQEKLSTQHSLDQFNIAVKQDI